MTTADNTVPTADAQESAAPTVADAAEATGAEQPKAPKAKRAPKEKKPALNFVVVNATGQVRAYRGVPIVDFKNGETGIWELAHMSRLKPDTLIKVHNAIRPEKPITKITNRAALEKQLYPAALEVLAGTPLPGGGKVVKGKTPADTTTTSTEDTTMAADKKSAAKKSASKKTAAKKGAAKKESTGRRGRASQFSGKTITKVKDSTRQEGSLCHASWVIIERAKNGISYEDFIAKGGRRKDLAWELAHGNVKVK